MLKKYAYFLNTALALVCLFSVSFVPTLVSAQFNGGNIGGQTNGSINIQGVGAVVLSCAQQSLDSIDPSNLPFGLGGASDAVEEEVVDEVGDALGISPTDLVSVQSVAVNNNDLEAKTEAIKKNTTSIKKDEARSTKKERCEDKVARYVALQAIDRITFATLEWINSGFEGKPFFVENSEQFFSDFATQEILGFGADFSINEDLFPFGKTIFLTLLTSFQQTFQQNMVNSLNNYLAHGTREQWALDFSVGGWVGYTAYVEPNNNIFGSYIESSRNIQNNLQGTRIPVAINVQEELRQGFGFLSQRACAQTESGGDYIKENSIQHISVGVPQITAINQIPTNVYTYITACGADNIFDEDGDGQADSDGLCEAFDADIIATAEDFRGRSICTHWKTLTPGGLIAEQATRAIGTSQDQTILVDELNESLGLLLDALFNQFITKGLVSFYESSGNYTEDNVAWAQVNGLNPGEPQDAMPFIDVINGFENTEDGNFPGLIPIQREYISGVTTLIGLYGEITQRTLDLDYCVPGPNPGWQTPSAQSIADFFSVLPAYETLPQSYWLQASPQVPLLVVYLSTLLPTNDQGLIYQYINDIYTILTEFFTGVQINNSALSPQFSSKNGQLLPILYSAFEQYAEFVNQRFILADDFSDNLRSKASNFFFNLDNISNQIGQYENSIVIINQTLEDLIQLREEYAQIEYPIILEYLNNAVTNQGMSNLADNLSIFIAFTPSQITYIGNGNQNSAYHNAVITLTNEVGEFIGPTVSNPLHAQILDELLTIIPNTVTQEYVESLNQTIEDTLDDIGNPGSPNSLVGLVYSCIEQINETGPYQNIPFTGYTERKEYPYPLSQDIPGLLNLPTTTTFLQDKTVSTNINDVSLQLTPAFAVGAANNLSIFEINFMNLGNSLY